MKKPCSYDYIRLDDITDSWYFGRLENKEYEAAAIDGIGNISGTIIITLPLMKPQLLFGAINIISWLLRGL